MDILGMPRDALRLRDSNIGSVRLRPGGVGRNIACHIARLGVPCHLLTVFGTDGMADILRDSCLKDGIDISRAMIAAGNSCIYLCLHDESGDMLAAVNDMALTESLTADYAASQMDLINASDLCVLDANPPVDTVRYIAENAAVPILLDPVSCAKLDRVRGVLPYISALKPNIHEAQALTQQNDAAECAHALIHAGVKRVFISLGAEGICYADAEDCGILPVMQYSTAIKTGAGDALCAGISIALAHGESTLECAKYGMQCAADYLNEMEE